MNNEPVAWMWNEDGCNLGVVLDQDKKIGKQEFQDYSIPLYTHPAKTLTELEILDVWVSSNFVGYTENGQIDEIFFNKFANAILRKAQEK